jgi:D-amino-acid oxidase
MHVDHFMPKKVAIVGAGVSGLTCGILFAERGYETAIFAEEIGQQTTSAVAGALWFPYDFGTGEIVIAWALETYMVLADLARDPRSGVSMIELRQISRTSEIVIPQWAHPLGAQRLSSLAIPGQAEGPLNVFRSGFALSVPLTDTTIYLDYLANRLQVAGSSIVGNTRFEKLEEVSREFDLVINCAGIGAKTLASDPDLEPHRGQVALVPKLDLDYALVCDDDPLTYIIPRANDCVFGGTNELSDNRVADPKTTARILSECSGVLNIDAPKILAERVGLRPFRRSGVCVERAQLRDGRAVIHNYGHGGSGFTLSWGCAKKVFDLAGTAR